MPLVRPRVGERLGGDDARAQRVAGEQRARDADGEHERVELPLPVIQAVVSAALRIAEAGEVHGEHAVVSREQARDGVPGVARLQEAPDEHDRRAVRAESLVVREHAARLHESPGGRERTAGMLVRRGRGVVDRRAAGHPEREGESADADPLRDASGARHGIHSNREQRKCGRCCERCSHRSRRWAYC